MRSRGYDVKIDGFNNQNIGGLGAQLVGAGSQTFAHTLTNTSGVTWESPPATWTFNAAHVNTDGTVTGK